MYELIAHIRKSDGREQSLKEHSLNVAQICENASRSAGLQNLTRLTGTLHDAGKGQKFASYLRWVARHPGEKLPRTIEHLPHAPIGAIYAYERWFEKRTAGMERLTAQIISMCIYGHHAGLPDCLNDAGESAYLDAMTQDKPSISYAECIRDFTQEVMSESELDALFEKACEETRAFIRRMDINCKSFQTGLLTRLILSVLVDADRWDSACFEYETDPLASEDSCRLPDWDGLLDKLNEYARTHFKVESGLNDARAQISSVCEKSGLLESGVYRLTVPTGGGKTLSSLRYALVHAEAYRKRRIFYVIPFNTILDQNAKDIRDALGQYESILEHHANVVQETEDEQRSYKLLTERWNSDIILTSLVQFLNSLFRGENSAARRMNRLFDSVIIFDEIQALPVKCKALFNKAVRFLTKCCGCTVLLCTATQPRMGIDAKELIPDVKGLYRDLKRVTYTIDLAPKSYDVAAEIISRELSKRSVLAVVNTKQAAWSLYEKVRERMVNDIRLAKLEIGASSDHIEAGLADIDDKTLLCVHLSTLMCPAHRMDVIRHIRTWTKRKRRVFCASTALIEAGINVSFPIVMRSLAGLASVIQAAGRCNRNKEEDLGRVLVWLLDEENLRGLPEIQAGQEFSRSVLSQFASEPDSIAAPEAIDRYFELESKRYEGRSEFPFPEWNTNLCDMLGVNERCKNSATSLASDPLPNLSGLICQSFRTAGEAFEVIPQNTRAVLVPYGKGKELIEKLNGKHSMKEEIPLLKRAQEYAVNLYENVYRRLNDEGALVAIGETGATALREEYYDMDGGVRVTPREMENYIY